MSLLVSELELYANDVAVGATGINPGTLQSHLQKGIFKPSLRVGKGHGSRCLYSVVDLVVLRLATQLTNYGVPFDYAAEFARTILKEHEWDYDFWLGFTREEAEETIDYQFVTRDNGQRAFRSFAELAAAVRPQYLEMLVFVSVGKVAREVKEHLESLST